MALSLGLTGDNCLEAALGTIGVLCSAPSAAKAAATPRCFQLSCFSGTEQCSWAPGGAVDG